MYYHRWHFGGLLYWSTPLEYPPEDLVTYCLIIFSVRLISLTETIIFATHCQQCFIINKISPVSWEGRDNTVYHIVKHSLQRLKVKHSLQRLWPRAHTACNACGPEFLAVHGFTWVNKGCIDARYGLVHVMAIAKFTHKYTRIYIYILCIHIFKLLVIRFMVTSCVDDNSQVFSVS
jgi:hypothetical protein